MNAMKDEPEIIEGNGYFVEVIRTRRSKSASLKVEDGVVTVVVPKQLEQERIIQLINGVFQGSCRLKFKIMPPYLSQFLSCSFPG